VKADLTLVRKSFAVATGNESYATTRWPRQEAAARDVTVLIVFKE